MSDRLLRFVLRNAPVRGELVSLDLSWSEIVMRHVLPTAVRNQLGELAAAGLLLAATLKFEGKLILQIHGKGPVSLFVVECDANATFRATVKLRADISIPEGATLDQLVNEGDGGRFVVTLDPGSRGGQSYQGIVPFDGGSIAHALEHYMTRSEQVPTRLWLAADENRATGLLLQRLPDHGGKAEGATIDEDGWNRLNLLADTLRTDELLTLPTDEVLQHLFWQESLDGREERACRFECSCNRAKVGSMLRMLGREEIEEVLNEQSTVTVNCDFCNQSYEFDAVDCAELFATEDSALRPPSGSAMN